MQDAQEDRAFEVELEVAVLRQFTDHTLAAGLLPQRSKASAGPSWRVVILVASPLSKAVSTTAVAAKRKRRMKAALRGIGAGS
jgi:hypothetical protein